MAGDYIEPGDYDRLRTLELGTPPERALASTLRACWGAEVHIEAYEDEGFSDPGEHRALKGLLRARGRLSGDGKGIVLLLPAGAGLELCDLIGEWCD